MIKLKIKGKILCLTLVTGALSIMAFGSTTYLGLANISLKLIDWETQSSTSASATLENLSAEQSRDNLNIIADTVSTHISDRLHGRIDDVKRLAEKLTMISMHPENYLPRKLPEAMRDKVYSGEVYINYGVLRRHPLDPEVKYRSEILSNIADTMHAESEFYQVYHYSLYCCSEDGYSINIDQKSDEPNSVLILDPEERDPDYDLRRWPGYLMTKATNNIMLSEPYSTRQDAKFFSICMPYYDSKGFAGIAGLDISMKNIFGNMHLSRVLAGLDFFVLDHKGKILFSSRKQGELLENQRITNPGMLRDQALVDVVGKMRNGERGIAVVEVDGESNYLAYAPIVECNWSFAVVEDLQEANSQLLFSQKQLSGNLQTLRSALDSALLDLYYLFHIALVVLLLTIIFTAVKQAGRFTKPVLRLVARVAEVTQGQLDNRIEIHTGDEFEELANSFNTMTAELKKHMQDTQRLIVEKEHIATELNVATKIQRSMLPHRWPTGHGRYDLYAMSIPAKEVGGDFYDFYLLDPDHLVITIADVSGKGVPAALFMVISKTILKNNALMMKELSLEQIVDQANLQLCQDNHEEMFVTVFIGVLGLNSGKFTYVSAGHNPPLLGKKDKQKYTYLFPEENRPMLGVIDDITYVQHSFDLQEGDTLFMYTDGVTEAMDIRGEQFGTERLSAVLNKSLQMGLKEQSDLVLNEVRKFADKAEQSDDITMLSLRYLGRVCSH